jgi:hypothetical protein
VARKRSPENDYVCTMCGCPSDPPGVTIVGGHPPRHLGGGSTGMRACRRARPMLRTEWEAMLDGFARDAAAALRERRWV